MGSTEIGRGVREVMSGDDFQENFVGRKGSIRDVGRQT